MWDEIFQNNRQLLTKAMEMKSNEALRIGQSQFNTDDLYGVDGTFKQLNID